MRRARLMKFPRTAAGPWTSRARSHQEKRYGHGGQRCGPRLRVSINTLRYWRISGDGPNYVKLGRLVRYDAGVLEKFIQCNLRVSKARATTEEKHVAL